MKFFIIILVSAASLLSLSESWSHWSCNLSLGVRSHHKDKPFNKLWPKTLSMENPLMTWVGRASDGILSNKGWLFAWVLLPRWTSATTADEPTRTSRASTNSLSRTTASPVSSALWINIIFTLRLRSDSSPRQHLRCLNHHRSHIILLLGQQVLSYTDETQEH